MARKPQPPTGYTIVEHNHPHQGGRFYRIERQVNSEGQPIVALSDGVTFVHIPQKAFEGLVWWFRAGTEPTWTQE